MDQPTAPVPGAVPQLLLQTLEQSEEAIVVVDPAARVVVANHSARHLFSDAALVGRDARQLLPAALLADPSGAVAGAMTADASVQLPRGDGSTFPARVCTQAIESAGGRFSACYIRDISDEERQQAHVRQLLLAVDESRNAVLVCDAASRITYANRGFTAMFGYALHEVLGRQPDALLLGDDSDHALAACVRKVRESGKPYEADLLAYTRHGSPFWVGIAANPIRDDRGAITHYVGIATDLTHHRLHQVLQHRVLVSLVRETPVADVLAAMCSDMQRFAPGIVASILKLDAHGRLRLLAAPDLPPALAETFHRDTVDGPDGVWNAAARRGEALIREDNAVPGEWAEAHAPLAAHGFRASWAWPVESGNGQVLGVLLLHSRAPGRPNPLHARLAELCLHLCALALERESTRERVHQLAYYDTLTGLPNRVLFTAQAERLLADTRQAGKPLAVMFVDMDRFKLINDAQGHAVGDELLRDTAARLTRTLDADCLIGRQASDEFVALLPGMDAEQAALRAERVLAALAQPMPLGQLTLHPSASIGIALHPGDGSDIETLLRNADLAMYRAKLAGGNGFRFYSTDMNRIVQENVALETALREAVRRNQLHLCFQPQVEAGGTHRLHGVEALVRWQHPVLGAVPPDRFIPIAEDCGLIGEISRWVLRASCAQMAEWRQRGIAVPRVSANLSPLNFQDPQLPAQIAGLLREFGLGHDDLAIELTEGVALIDDPVVTDNLEAIHAMGIHLSLDDFGTGYSSLSHLHRLPIDEIKLDKSFVRDLESSASARALTTSVLQLGATLDKRIVAEGVETEHQRNFLAGLDCDVLQGYLFSRPLASGPFEHWLHEHHRHAEPRPDRRPG